MPDKPGKPQQPADRAGPGYLVPALIGIAGGFIAVGIPLVVSMIFFWRIKSVILHDLFYEFSPEIGKIPQMQVFLILLIGTIFIGFLLPRILVSRIQKMTDVIYAGIISGTCTGFVIAILLFLMPAIFLDYFNVNNYLSLAVSAILLSLVFQVVGAIGGYLWFRNKSSALSTVGAGAPVLSIIAIPGSVALILMIIVLVLPLMVPTVDWQKCNGFGDVLKIERLDDTTLKITQLNENSPQDCLSDKPYINKISLDGRDVSNQAVIDKEGLSDTIDPPEGLMYANGSQVVLEGPEVQNKSHAPHLDVKKYRQNNDGSLTFVRLLADVNV
jgi:hypothetical protein